jgi:hypothetical protein
VALPTRPALGPSSRRAYRPSSPTNSLSFATKAKYNPLDSFSEQPTVLRWPDILRLATRLSMRDATGHSASPGLIPEESPTLDDSLDTRRESTVPQMPQWSGCVIASVSSRRTRIPIAASSASLYFLHDAP